MNALLEFLQDYFREGRFLRQNLKDLEQDIVRRTIKGLNDNLTRKMIRSRPTNKTRLTIKEAIIAIQEAVEDLIDPQLLIHNSIEEIHDAVHEATMHPCEYVVYAVGSYNAKIQSRHGKRAEIDPSGEEGQSKSPISHRLGDNRGPDNKDLPSLWSNYNCYTKAVAFYYPTSQWMEEQQ